MFDLEPATPQEVEQIRQALHRLEQAMQQHRSERWCLRLWSQFVRLRDGNRCVTCGATDGCNAHHVFRRSREPAFRLLPGNGITLCREHHRNLHEDFNGRPLPGEALNARGGEDPNEMGAIFGFLADDADKRSLPLEEFYHLSTEFLTNLKVLQGIPLDFSPDGPSIRQAEALFSTAPLNWYESLAELIAQEFITGKPVEVALQELEERRRKERIH